MNGILQLIHEAWKFLSYFFLKSKVKEEDKKEDRKEDKKESDSSNTVLSYLFSKPKEKEEDKNGDRKEDNEEDKKESDSSKTQALLSYFFSKSKEKGDDKDESRKQDKDEDRKQDKDEDRKQDKDEDRKQDKEEGEVGDSNTTISEPSGTQKLALNLKELLLGGNDSDVTIRVQGQSFPAHKCILGARTPVFSCMFRHEMKEKATGIVDVADCEPDVFREFLHYVYTGTVASLTGENVFGLYKVADKYQVDELKAECVRCLKSILSVDSFCDVLALAVRHGEKELLKLATAFFADRMKEILLTVKWQIFMDENSTQANELLIKALVPGSGKCLEV